MSWMKKPKKKLMKRAGLFPRFANATATASGKPATFVIALAVILAWGVSGPIFGFSDTWQLVINTSTTIITFLMVFLIQNTQNRESQAVQLKLDELIRSKQGAHTAMLDLEELSDAELARLHRMYVQLAVKGREKLRRGEIDTDVPDCDPEERSSSC